MALGTPTSFATAAASSGATTTTSSVTPAQGDLLLAYAFPFRTPSDPVEPTVTDSLGGTWTKVGSQPSTGLSVDAYAAIYGYTETSASPAARTITAASTGANAIALQVVKISGGRVRAVSGSPNVAGAVDLSTGDPSGNLPNAPLSTNTVVSFAGTLNADNVPDAGWTEILDYDAAGSNRLCCAYRTGSTSTAFGYTSTATLVAIAMAVEVEDAATGQPAAKRFGGVPGMALIPGVW